MTARLLAELDALSVNPPPSDEDLAVSWLLSRMTQGRIIVCPSCHGTMALQLHRSDRKRTVYWRGGSAVTGSQAYEAALLEALVARGPLAVGGRRFTVLTYPRPCAECAVGIDTMWLGPVAERVADVVTAGMVAQAEQVSQTPPGGEG